MEKVDKLARRRGVFRFKQFECAHYGSSMRIGVDAVLLGAWADVSGDAILDAGTGCGVIALMCAQRNRHAIIDAVDIDENSVGEASHNAAQSPWCERISVSNADFSKMTLKCRYDLIISNPPYFHSGVEAGVSARMTARHEGSLSPLVLLRRGTSMLTDSGRIAMIIPALRADEIITGGEDCGFRLIRRLDVKGNVDAPVKRTLLEFGKKMTGNHGFEGSGRCADERPGNRLLILEEEPGIPTPEYRALCKDFYLYF